MEQLKSQQHQLHSLALHSIKTLASTLPTSTRFTMTVAPNMPFADAVEVSIQLCGEGDVSVSDRDLHGMGSPLALARFDH